MPQEEPALVAAKEDLTHNVHLSEKETILEDLIPHAIRQASRGGDRAAGLVEGPRLVHHGRMEWGVLLATEKDLVLGSVGLSQEGVRENGKDLVLGQVRDRSSDKA